MLEIKQFIEKCQQIIFYRYGKIFVASLHNEKQGGSSNFLQHQVQVHNMNQPFILAVN